MSSKKISIKSGRGTYHLDFTGNLSQTLISLTKKDRLHFLIDSNVYKKYKSKITPSIKYATSFYLFKPSEKNKSITQVKLYIDFLLQNKIQTNQKILVIGGGLVQDIGSFTAHIILRGVQWIFIPTTYLAMSDSCIGSKSGINVGKYKNQVGSFHAPLHIYIYTNFLKSLPETDRINGIGEIIKHALIKGDPSFTAITKPLDLLGKNARSTVDILHKSLLIKKEIIEEDEYEEKDIRRKLNYGHTFGHALEGYTKNTIPHGTGVLIGMDIANFISLKRNYLNKTDFGKIHTLLKKYIPYKQIPITSVDQYIQFMARDKKALGSSVNALLCKGIGKIFIHKIALDKRLAKEITQYLDYFNNSPI